MANQLTDEGWVIISNQAYIHWTSTQKNFMRKLLGLNCEEKFRGTKADEYEKLKIVLF